jgi:hypothetical protein
LLRNLLNTVLGFHQKEPKLTKTVDCRLYN